MLSELAFSLLFEKEVDGDRASRSRRSYDQALADPEHERRFDEAYQALVAKQVPGPISFTSAEEPCRTASNPQGVSKYMPPAKYERWHPASAARS
jgi:hypothetical protein